MVVGLADVTVMPAAARVTVTALLLPTLPAASLCRATRVYVRAVSPVAVAVYAPPVTAPDTWRTGVPVAALPA